MLIVVTTVSALVHLYSFGYMAHDDNFREGESYRPRFFAYLSFFTFAMLMLVTADNLVQMFFGWEGVGLASYLLIGFYYRKPSANAAAIKAFIVNRVGDFGFAAGHLRAVLPGRLDPVRRRLRRRAELAETRSLPLDRVERGQPDRGAAVHRRDGQVGAAVPAHLAAGRDGRPDAGLGADPRRDHGDGGRVPRLPHVAADGIRARATNFITFIGAATAFFAATVGLVQNDIKRVIAYSTCRSWATCSWPRASASTRSRCSTCFTHAFFKAMLFLGAGSVIHAMHHEQDMRNYGGLRKKIPYTFWAMMIGTLAITGVGIPLTYIGFAGFLSKDAIIESAWAGQRRGFAFWALVIAALFTSFYSWRLMFLTFYGEPRGDKHTHEHAHESPMVMLVPLGVLALGAVFSGMVWYNSFFGKTDRSRSSSACPNTSRPMAGTAAWRRRAHGERPTRCPWRGSRRR
jgi:NADH-quinone oxidoreductase subunit L